VICLADGTNVASTMGDPQRTEKNRKGINAMGQNDAEANYYEKGRAQQKHGSSTANPTSLIDRPSKAERDAAQRGYEDQRQAEELKKKE
jgi:hypothetical protein